MSVPSTNNNDHFNMKFWYAAVCSIFVAAYITCITFLPIPKQNMRYVDLTLAFLMGTLLSGSVNYIMGGSLPTTKKPDLPPGTTQTDLSITEVTEKNDDNNGKK